MNYTPPNPTAPGPVAPAPALVDSQERSALAFERVKDAAKRHHLAVQTAIVTDTSAAVQEVLVAGTALDHALRNALEWYSVKQLSEVADLHSLYVESLNNEYRL